MGDKRGAVDIIAVATAGDCEAVVYGFTNSQAASHKAATKPRPKSTTAE